MHDTFSYVKKLREAQVPTEQAEAHIDVLSLAISRLATKEDLEKGLQEVRTEMHRLEVRIEARFLKIEKEIQELRLQVERMRFGFVVILFATQVDIVDFVRMILSRL